MTIADNFPKTACQTMVDMTKQTKAYLLPLLEEQRLESGKWINQACNDTSDNLKVWSEKCTAEVNANSASVQKVVHHCAILKLIERLLWAYSNADDVLKISLRTL